MTRFSILLSSALLLVAPNVLAQTYTSGSQISGYPQSSAQFGTNAGASMPDLSAGQIAADVALQFNPRTGAREYIAPTFDPFENEADLAATVNLRSTTGALDVTGRVVSDGALLDVSLFYTDRGDRQFGRVRDSVFLNGQPAPMVLQDSRELECSSRVTEHVYLYDGRGSNPYLRARPRYWGHRGFGFGTYAGSRFGVGQTHSRNRSRARNTHTNRSRPTPRRTVTPTPRTTVRPTDRPRVRSTPASRLPVLHPRTLDRGQGYRVGPDRQRIPPVERQPRRDRSHQSGNDLAAPSVRPNRVRPTRARTLPAVTRRNRIRTEPRRTEPRRTETPRTETRGTAPRRSDTTRTETRRPETSRPSTRRSEPAASRPAPQPQRRTVTPPPQNPKRGSGRRTEPRLAPDRQPRRARTEDRRRPSQLDMFPGDGYSSSVVVNSQRDCAREDQLVLFIPSDRLEAARFDGLTLILRDVTRDPRTGQTTVYGERPLYIPPNYIEGFRIATRQP